MPPSLSNRLLGCTANASADSDILFMPWAIHRPVLECEWSNSILCGMTFIAGALVALHMIIAVSLYIFSLERVCMSLPSYAFGLFHWFKHETSTHGQEATLCCILNARTAKNTCIFSWKAPLFQDMFDCCIACCDLFNFFWIKNSSRLLEPWESN